MEFDNVDVVGHCFDDDPNDDLNEELNGNPNGDLNEE